MKFIVLLTALLSIGQIATAHELTPEQKLTVEKAAFAIAEVDKDHIFVRPIYAAQHPGWTMSTYDIRKPLNYDMYRVVPIAYREQDEVMRVAVWVNVIGVSPDRKEIAWGGIGGGLLRYLMDINSKNEIINGPVFNITGNSMPNDDATAWVGPNRWQPETEL